MNDTIIMHILESNNATRYEKFCLLLRELFAFIMMVAEVTSRDQIGDKKQILIVLEGIKHVDQEAKNGKDRQITKLSQKEISN